MRAQIILLTLPVGLWVAILVSVISVLTTYYRANMWRNYGRMASEIIPAAVLSGAAVEYLQLLHSPVLCAFVALMVGAVSGFAIDYWQRVGRHFVHNVFNVLSMKFTGRELPPPDFSDFRQPENLPPAQVQETTPPPPPKPQSLHIPTPTPRPRAKKRKRRK